MKRIYQRGARRIGIQGKLTLILVLLSTVPLLLVGSYVIQRQIDFLKAEQLRRLDSDVGELKERLSLFLSGTERELRFLGNATMMRQLVQDLQRLDEVRPPVGEAAEREMINLLEGTASYRKVALLDKDGGEVLAVSYDPKTRQAGVERRQAQKVNYFYVYAVGEMKPGEATFSPCEIQLANTGPAPAIDCILPLFDSQKKLTGILVGSINAATLFALFDTYHQSSGKVLIANSEGYYLYHSQRKKDWNMLLARREEENVFHDYPEQVAKRVLSGKSGTITEGGDRVIEYTTVFSTGNGKASGYHLIRDLPTSEVFAAVQSMRAVFVAGLLGIGLLSALCANWLARRFLLPVRQLIRGTTIIRNGDLNYKLEVQSQDEVQELVENFNEMVAHWQETRSLEDKIRRSEELYTAIVESAHDAIISLALDGTVQSWNLGAERIYGHATKDALGQPVTALAPSRPPELLAGFHERVRQGNRIDQQQIPRVRQDGQLRQISTTMFPIWNEAGAVTGIASVERDETEKQRMTEQMLHNQRLESIGTLAGGIAHDLNNVLTPVLMGLEIMKMRFTDPASRKTLSTIESSAQRGAEMVKQVLKFSRGGAEGARLVLDLRHLLREIKAVIQSTFPKSIRVELGMAEDLWAIEGDPTQLHQVVMNLCVNARDAMPQGGKLRLMGENVQVDENYARMNLEARPGSYVKLEISDTGMGMPPGVKDRMFEPFFTTKEPGKGTGLGLATVRGIIKGFGGFINVYSEVGKGTVFRLYFPAQETTEMALVAAGPLGLAPGNGELILVVDDEEAIADIAKQTLERCHYRVLTAHHGAEAIALFVPHRAEVKLVLTDMMMPVMDGRATIAALRNLNPLIKIIVSTGLISEFSDEDRERMEADAFLHKPYTAQTLAQQVHDVLRKPFPNGKETAHATAIQSELPASGADRSGASMVVGHGG